MPVRLTMAVNVNEVAAPPPLAADLGYVHRCAAGLGDVGGALILAGLDQAIVIVMANLCDLGMVIDVALLDAGEVVVAGLIDVGDMLSAGLM